MLHAKNLTLKLWGEAVKIAAYLFNRPGSQTREYKTSYELWMGMRPAVQHLRVFGNLVYTHIPKEKRQKLDAKSLKTILVGYSSESKAYRLWDSVRRKIVISRDVIFDKYTLPCKAPSDAFSGLFSFQTNFGSKEHINEVTSNLGILEEKLK
jgi:hypothetical protein